VLPEIDANVALFREGFSLGKFTLLEMLDSQKALFELRERILAGRLALQTSILEIEFLTGFSLDPKGPR
jgi:outer membrane protein TolC